MGLNSYFFFYNQFTVVINVTVYCVRSVRQVHSAGFRADCQTWLLGRIVCPPFISSGFGRFTFWMCHLVSCILNFNYSSLVAPTFPIGDQPVDPSSPPAAWVPTR